MDQRRMSYNTLVFTELNYREARDNHTIGLLGWNAELWAHVEFHDPITNWLLHRMNFHTGGFASSKGEAINNTLLHLVKALQQPWDLQNYSNQKCEISLGLIHEVKSDLDLNTRFHIAANYHHVMTGYYNFKPTNQ